MIKLHVGCGKRDFGEDWIHVDGAKHPHISCHDVYAFDDLFQPNSINLIYASHMVEYFDRKDVANILAKWHSLMSEGGVIRLAVPDFESIWDEYECSNNLDCLLGMLYGKMKLNDQIIYHKTIYDFDSLKKVLEAAGFKDVRRYNWEQTDHAQFDDHSQAYLPHMDKKNGRLMSLNVEATK
jgi:predicted SAM-dependent methyltransferase